MIPTYIQYIVLNLLLMSAVLIGGFTAGAGLLAFGVNQNVAGAAAAAVSAFLFILFVYVQIRREDKQ